MVSLKDASVPDMTAALRVFNITELLENILIFTSRLDILFAQRVCSKFNDTIQDSSQLQRKLFGATQKTVDDGLHENPRKIYANLSNMYAHLAKLEIHPSTLPEVNFHSKVSKFPRLTFGLELPWAETLGWKGKSRVHERGSWEKIKIGTDDRTLIVLARFSYRERCGQGQISAQGTLGDLIDALEQLKGVVERKGWRSRIKERFVPERGRPRHWAVRRRRQGPA